MNRFSLLKQIHAVMHTIIACFVSGCAAIFLVRLGIGCNVDKIAIGVIMLFIPTLALVNGVRDIFYRDTLTGIFRLVEAMLTASAIALGFALSLMVLGGLV